MKKQRNNHARSDRKRKLLRLQNKIKWVFNRRKDAMDKARRPKGVTIVGKDAPQVVYIPYDRRMELYGYLFADKNYTRKNQRKRRKMERQNPYLRNK